MLVEALQRAILGVTNVLHASFMIGGALARAMGVAGVGFGLLVVPVNATARGRCGCVLGRRGVDDQHVPRAGCGRG